MKSVLTILAALAASAALARAQDAADADVVTPGGVGIEAVRVYVTAKQGDSADKGEWRDPALEFSHGNATLRLRLSNTNDTPQRVRAQLPLTIGAGAAQGRAQHRRMIIAAGVKVPPGETLDLDMPVPMVGRVSFCRPDDVESPRIRLADSVGDCRSFGELAQFGYSVESHGHALCNPSSRTIAADLANADEPILLHIAISQAAQRFNFAEAHSRVAKARQELAATGEQTAVRIEIPDFTRFRRWQDLSVYDMIVVDEDDWAALPSAVKAILPDWVAAGGTLAIIGSDEPVIAPGSYGLGKVVALGASSPDLDALFKSLVSTMNRHSLATSPFDCDIKASDAVAALRSETPFSTILIILLTFCILAGPVLAVALAKSNRRISLLWIFPVMAIAFSLGVMGVIVCAKGIDPELRQFVHTIYDEKAGRVVTICNHVILAPFGLHEDIRLDAKDSIVAYISGDVNRCGDTIICTGSEFVFRDGWAPTLWPVVFRTVTVRAIGDAPAKPPIPVDVRLQEHYVAATEERRAAK